MVNEHERMMDYVSRHSSVEDSLLYQLYRETNLTTVYPRMLSGHLQGQLLKMISQMIKPLRILEIGTFTGYSAICMAAGLPEGGRLHTIDINDEVAETARKYFRLAGLEDVIILHTGNALEIIPALNERFDLIFIDADKEEYMKYYQVSFPVWKTGGFLIADNVLWSGKVLPDSGEEDKETRCLREFNTSIAADDRVEKFMLPFRDGLFILRKTSD